MPDLLFLVHGMGRHEEGWHEPMVAALKEHYQRYAPLSDVPFENRFEVVPVTYDDRMREIVEKWQKDAKVVGDAAKDADVRLVQDLTGWLRQAGEATHYEWTHAADVLLYRIYPSVQEAVKVHVAAQIASAVNGRNAGQGWSVLGYSLGTAVTHDALHGLWTDRFRDGTGTGFQADQERALLVAQVANVSRVLQTKPKVYESTVKPGSAAQKRGCRYFLTARHKLDPFTTPAPFDPVAWPDAGAVQRGVFASAHPDHIHQWNVHAFEHYVASPDVHVPLFRMLLADEDHDFLTDEAEEEAQREFKPFGDLKKTAALSIKSWLDDRLPASSSGWEVLASVWDRFNLGEHLFG